MASPPFCSSFTTQFSSTVSSPSPNLYGFGYSSYQNHEHQLPLPYSQPQPPPPYTLNPHSHYHSPPSPNPYTSSAAYGYTSARSSENYNTYEQQSTQLDCQHVGVSEISISHSPTPMASASQISFSNSTIPMTAQPRLDLFVAMQESICDIKESLLALLDAVREAERSPKQMMVNQTPTPPNLGLDAMLPCPPSPSDLQRPNKELFVSYDDEKTPPDSIAISFSEVTTTHFPYFSQPPRLSSAKLTKVSSAVVEHGLFHLCAAPPPVATPPPKPPDMLRVPSQPFPLLRMQYTNYVDKSPTTDAAIWCDGGVCRVALDTLSLGDDPDCGNCGDAVFLGTYGAMQLVYLFFGNEEHFYIIQEACAATFPGLYHDHWYVKVNIRSDLELLANWFYAFSDFMSLSTLEPCFIVGNTSPYHPFVQMGGSFIKLIHNVKRAKVTKLSKLMKRRRNRIFVGKSLPKVKGVARRVMNRFEDGNIHLDLGYAYIVSLPLLWFMNISMNPFLFVLFSKSQPGAFFDAKSSVSASPTLLEQVRMIVSPGKNLDMFWRFKEPQLQSKTPVFHSTCTQVKPVLEVFKKLHFGILLRYLHEGMKRERKMAIYSELCKKHSFLLSMGMAARGLGFNNAIVWVVQVDCLENVASYIHGVDNTASYKSGGISVLFLLPSKIQMLEKLKATKVSPPFTKARKESSHPVTNLLASLVYHGFKEFFKSPLAHNSVVESINKLAGLCTTLYFLCIGAKRIVEATEGLLCDLKAELMQKKQHHILLFYVPSRRGQQWGPGGQIFTFTMIEYFQFRQWDPGKLFKSNNCYNLEDKVGLDGQWNVRNNTKGYSRLNEDVGPAQNDDKSNYLLVILVIFYYFICKNVILDPSNDW